MRAGSLRTRVVIEQRATALDSFGQQTTTWTTFAAVFASIEPMSGRELLAAQAVNSELTHKVTMRYQAGITPAMRVVYQGRIFNIQNVIDPSMTHISLELQCVEGLNQG